MISWHTHPLVSVLLITTSPSRRALVEQAIACFEAQDWPLRELVLINGTGYPFHIAHGQQVRVGAKSPGTLKNMALECAQGEWCVWWDDACWFEPGYISLHMVSASKPRVTVAGILRVYNVGTQQEQVVHAGQLAGFFRLQSRRYLENGDDEQFFSQFLEKRVLDASEHVLKFVHECATHS